MLLTDAERQELYRTRVYTPEQRARIEYWQSMWEKSMHNPNNKLTAHHGDVDETTRPVPFNPNNPSPRTVSMPDPWPGLRGTPAPCCRETAATPDVSGTAPFSDKDLSILTEAHALVHGDRQATYGHPAVDFSRTAALVNVLLAHKLSADLGPEDVALLMVAVKLSRECHEHKRDNLVDAAGYLECRERVLRFLGGAK